MRFSEDGNGSRDERVRFSEDGNGSRDEQDNSSDWRGLRDSFAATGWDYHELMTPEDFAWVVEGLNWSSVAAPCSTLIQVLLLDAGENASSLSWVELERLHDCVYWRHIGHHVVQAFNLTSVAPHDAFLLSVDDLMFTLRHTDLLRQCVLNPGIVGAALLAHPWARPVRFVAHEAWEWVSRLSATRLPASARQNSTDDMLAEELKAMMQELELQAMMQDLEALEVTEPESKALEVTEPESKALEVTEPESKALEVTEPEEEKAREVVEPEEEAPASRHHSRRLLSTPVRLRHVRASTGGTPVRLLQTLDQTPRRRLLQTLDQTVQSVQQYSASVLHAASMARQQQVRVTGVAAEALTRGPFSWPPIYFQQDVAAGLGSCFIAEVLLKHVQTVVQVRLAYPLPPRKLYSPPTDSNSTSSPLPPRKLYSPPTDSNSSVDLALRVQCTFPIKKTHTRRWTRGTTRASGAAARGASWTGPS